MMIQISYFPNAEDSLDIVASDPAWFEDVNSPEKAIEAIGRLERLLAEQNREQVLSEGVMPF